MGLDDPNFDGKLNEIVSGDLAEVTIDEDAQRQSEIERAAERKRKRELAKERERREKEVAIERKLEEQAYAYNHSRISRPILLLAILKQFW
jgi:hypothetical protein